MSIELLDNEIINQIAAGEVIENPAAVVKELVENSLDAKATRIDIELQNSGFKSILIRDNGVGISKEDLPKAPIRHSTSKIKNFNDLYSIKTMGFRGEALASIFSVAKTTLTSKIENEEAHQITSESMRVEESSGSIGTSVLVEDLFYNTPARKKYLKSENLELKTIIDIVKRFELVHNNIHFILKNNGKILSSKPAFDNKVENISYILDTELRRNLIEVNNEQNGLKITGFIANPSSITHSFRKNQYLFVNNRYIQSKLIRDAIYEGFSTNLMENRHPVYCLYIEIDPEIIDVNVHPTKIEIKFENESEIHEFARKAIRKVFEKQELFKDFEKSKERNSTLNSLPDLSIVPEQPRIREEKTYFNKETQYPLEFETPKQHFVEDTWKEKEITYGPLYETLKEYRIVGQVNKTFVILETPKEMIVVDQHVAEEKFFFEKFRDELETANTKSQTLLKAKVISLTTQEMLLFEEYREMIKKLGFEAEPMGDRDIIVRKVPIGLKEELMPSEMIKEIIHEISADKKFIQLEEKNLDKLASMACRRSIKAGYEMTNHEIRTMIENLKRLKEPFNCPHGRPILLKYPFSELEKKFKRIV